jgi:Zn-dependent peptidase ImmA (M78 family)/DNA-binding XRE family transcriptional regulator
MSVISDRQRKKGSPRHFSPTRLTVARERRGLNKKTLADLVGLTPDAITKFEADQCQPLPETLQRFSFALQFPLGWFSASEIDLLDPKSLSFRSRRSMTAEIRGKATRAGDIAVSVITPELHRRFVLPDPAVPDLSDFGPEHAAELLRREWKLGAGPIENMVHLLEAKGVHTYWMREESPLLNAWSMWHGERPFVMLNIFNNAGCRARFDAAHELAHLVLHRDSVVEGLQMENEANLFAAAFLLPEDQFRYECPKYPILHAFYPLKGRWGVSIQAMIMRCKSLGIFSDWDTRRAFQEITSRGWKKAEPKELAIKREESRLQKMIATRLEAKNINASGLAKELHITSADLLDQMPFLEPYVEPQQKEVTKSEGSEDHAIQQTEEKRSKATHLRLLA